MILFTLEQAEAMLPQVSDELLAMQACKREVDELRQSFDHAAHKSTGNGHVKDEGALAEKRRQAEALVEQINERLARLNEWGVELKGIDEGLVDFPTRRGDRIIYLCSRLGEESITWWHEIDSGFAGRQSLYPP
jgi:hypothetical protein